MLLREQTLLRQWGNNGKAPAGAGTAAAVGEKQEALLLEQTLLQQWGKIQVALMGEQSLLR